MTQKCLIIGASHAGVNFAFNLRREGWKGEIILIDKDPNLPYHRPPLSKDYLSKTEISGNDLNYLKSPESYDAEEIQIILGKELIKLDRGRKFVVLQDGEQYRYDKLVIATGARALVPKISGINEVKNVFYLRKAADVYAIRDCLKKLENPHAIIIGGGYIGLETAASLTKLNVKVTVLEREERILARVTSYEMSTFFEELHQNNGVNIKTKENVSALEKSNEGRILVKSENGEGIEADLVIVGVGIKVNTAVWSSAGITIENGICIDERCVTNDPEILAIGDCSYFYSHKYSTCLRLESVQNAVDQAKVAAGTLVGKKVKYDAVPWFWSDQYNVKLQMVGISNGFDRTIIRKSSETSLKFSIWYFKGDSLLCVAAINDARSYMIGMKALKSNLKINIEVLQDNDESLSPKNLFL